MSLNRVSLIAASAALAALGGAAAATAAPASAAASYAAIAYSPVTGIWADSVGPESNAPAQAMNLCSASGPGCELAASATNGCVALAINSAGDWSGGYGPNAATANNRALAHVASGRLLRTVCA